MGSFLATFLYFSSSFVSGISKNNQYFVSQDSNTGGRSNKAFFLTVVWCIEKRKETAHNNGQLMVCMSNKQLRTFH